jgi:hypothetical protein
MRQVTLTLLVAMFTSYSTCYMSHFSVQYNHLFSSYRSSVCTIIFYYIKKYLVFHRYTSPKMLNKLIFDNSLTEMAYVPIFYGIGSRVFVAYIY